MTVYLDVIWFLNFCIDYVLISLTAHVLKRNASKKRILLATLAASSYVILIVYPQFMIFSQPVLKFLFSIVIMLIAFGFKRFRYTLKNLAMFYFVSFVTGGGIFALHYFMQTDAEIMNGVLTTRGSGMGDPVSWLFVVTGVPVLWYFSKKRIDDITVQKMDAESIVTVMIKIDEIEIQAIGLIDTGNKLYDPISKMPVMVLDMNIHGFNFPEAIQTASRDVLSIGSEDSDHPWVSRLRIVPYRSVGNQQFLACIKPDSIEIVKEGNHEKTPPSLVGFSWTALSSEGQFDAIVHPKMYLQHVQAS
ncbi:sigma-E processing peptidase SpoIIGA [Fictibacillus barbaricus]|uniref:Sporulation sigma-E factor-processing peptidase n=1 Tax=Fictibacillus barbaricus TaxID=182136 RepID=A0ABU1U4S6_9BACL|nr:sigma-E processing peptidase SpoIIGA [Fictibacillus barbaricus]MDR7074482.1 stage II sporulation protein GA (sporulation sigma-E factor processing peptidase) [Fictibacillus barbaricus]